MKNCKRHNHMAGRFNVINVKDYGAAQSRPRRVCQNEEEIEIESEEERIVGSERVVEEAI